MVLMVLNFGQRLLDLRGVAVGAADLVGGHRAHDLAGEEVDPGRAAGPGGAGGGDDHDVVRLDQALVQQGREREDGRGGVAAGGGDGAGGLDLLARAGEFGQAVGPAAGVRDVLAVELVPLILVAEAEVGRQVDDLRVRQLVREFGRLAVREGHEDELGVFERVGVGDVEVLAVVARVTGEVRVDRGDRLARAAAGRDRRDLQVGVAGQQAEQLSARVAAGPCDSDPYAHIASLLPEEVCTALHEYARWRCGRRVGSGGLRERPAGRGGG